MPAPSVNGRTAVVTGAGSGIGRALAQRMAAHGCPVAIADWDEAGLEETAGTLDVPVLARKVDVRSRQQVLAFAAEVVDWAPEPLGLLVNNAGVTVAQPFAGGSLEDDEWVHAVNFGGVVNGTHAFLPPMLDQRGGTIANVSSVFGLVGFPNQSAYCASKHAVRGFTESLRHELRGTGVRATTIHPGGIQTNIAAHARFHSDASGSADQNEFDAAFRSVARTSPERAAEIIHRGVERGKPRIRIGADAVLLDWLARAAPARYYDVLERLEPLIRRDGNSMRSQRRARARGR
jgi:NAD(P)-dependent dehydrogenase (short-subunit alcohol dehydrogenase family)